MNHSSKVAVGASAGLMFSILFPWAQWLGFGIPGYNLSQFGSIGHLAWTAPALGLLALILHIVPSVDQRVRTIVCILGSIFLVIPMMCISVMASHETHGDFWNGIGGGVYIAFTSAIFLFVAGCISPDYSPNDLSTAPQDSDFPQQPRVTQDKLTQLERLAGLHARGVLTDAEFEAQKKDILQ